MKVLIVGRTKMGGSGRCIGGVLLDGTSVRLLDLAGHHFDATAPFQVGEVWDIEFTCVTSIVPPHVEDCEFRFIRPCIPTRSRPLIPI